MSTPKKRPRSRGGSKGKRQATHTGDAAHTPEIGRLTAGPQKAALSDDAYSHLTPSASATSLDSESAVAAFRELDLQLGLHPAILSKEIYSFVYSKVEFPPKECNDLFLSLLGIVDKCHDARLESPLRDQLYSFFKKFFDGDEFVVETKFRIEMPADQSDARADIAVLDKKTLTPILLFEIKRNSGVELWNAAIQNARGYRFLKMNGRIKRFPFPCFLCQISGREWELHGAASLAKDGGMAMRSLSRFSVIGGDGGNIGRLIGLDLLRLRKAMRSMTYQEGESPAAFPWLTAIGDKVNVEYDAHLKRGVFDAQWDGKGVIVKFTRENRYGTAVHKFCAEKGFAPKLYEVDKRSLAAISSRVVIMEKIEGVRLSTVPAKKGAFDLQAIKRNIQAAITAIHGQGFVHGDFRSENILVRPDSSISVIDFDWSGRDGNPNVRYPPYVNEDIFGRGSRNRLIEKRNDDKMVKKMLSSIDSA